MKRYVIEREIPGASDLSHEELKAIAGKPNDVVESLGVPYHWITSTSQATKSTACTSPTMRTPSASMPAAAASAQQRQRHRQRVRTAHRRVAVNLLGVMKNSDRRAARSVRVRPSSSR